MNIKKYKHSIIGFIVIAFTLTMVNLKVKTMTMLLAERFFPGWAWLEILFVSFYGAYFIHKMIHSFNTARLRKLTWTIFSIVFFSQLILGLIGKYTGNEILQEFLMTGKLHLPVPALIIGGAVYNFKIGFMPILFLSTVILSGPAWCSQLCYFGAMDLQFASHKKGRPGKIKNKQQLKSTFLILVVSAAIFLRLFDVNITLTAILGGLFGIVGVAIMYFVSRKQKMMYHCTVYCPIGTVIQYIKYINPFRMYIDTNSCTLCMHCSTTCPYDALNPNDIKSGKPGQTCTYCGDCISSCDSSSIKYKLFNIKGIAAQNIWITLTISLHAIFLALARI